MNRQIEELGVEGEYSYIIYQGVKYITGPHRDWLFEEAMKKIANEVAPLIGDFARKMDDIESKLRLECRQKTTGSIIL